MKRLFDKRRKTIVKIYARHEPRLESDQVYELRRRLSDVEDRVNNLDLATSNMWNQMGLG